MGYSYWDLHDPLDFKIPFGSGITESEMEAYFEKIDAPIKDYSNNHEHTYIVGTLEKNAVKALNKIYPQCQSAIRRGNKDISGCFRATGGVFSTTGSEIYKIKKKND